MMACFCMGSREAGSYSGCNNLSVRSTHVLMSTVYLHEYIWHIPVCLLELTSPAMAARRAGDMCDLLLHVPYLVTKHHLEVETQLEKNKREPRTYRYYRYTGTCKRMDHGCIQYIRCMGVRGDLMHRNAPNQSNPCHLKGPRD